jgi:hypothetical protein
VEPVLAILRSGVQNKKTPVVLDSNGQPTGRGAVFVLPLQNHFHL